MYFSIVLTISLVIFQTCQGHIDPSTLFVTKFVVTYNEALQTCKSRGMKLVQINNEEENAVVNGFASQVIADAYWIDGNDQANEGTWRNSREQDLSFKNFAPNTPDGGVGENCINVFRLPKGLWNDYNCGARIWAICQRDVDNQGYSDHLEIEGNGFIVSNTRLTFSESQEYCTARNSKLITISSAMDNAIVHSFARETVSDLYWINVNDIDKEGTWVDSDGKPLLYRNFLIGQITLSMNLSLILFLLIGLYIHGEVGGTFYAGCQKACNSGYVSCMNNHGLVAGHKYYESWEVSAASNCARDQSACMSKCSQEF